MANEWSFRPFPGQNGISSVTGLTLYGVILDNVNQALNDGTFETYDPANQSSYAVDLAEINAPSGLYLADQPATTMGQYWMQVFWQQGDSPAYTDPFMGVMYLDWNGASQIDLTNLWTLLNTINGKISAGGAGSYSLYSFSPSTFVFNLAPGVDRPGYQPVGPYNIPLSFDASGGTFTFWNPDDGAAYPGFTVENVAYNSDTDALTFDVYVTGSYTANLNGQKNYQIRCVLEGQTLLFVQSTFTVGLDFGSGV